jgi:hypothetical protein
MTSQWKLGFTKVPAFDLVDRGKLSLSCKLGTVTQFEVYAGGITFFVDYHMVGSARVK